MLKIGKYVTRIVVKYKTQKIAGFDFLRLMIISCNPAYLFSYDENTYYIALSRLVIFLHPEMFICKNGH